MSVASGRSCAQPLEQHGLVALGARRRQLGDAVDELADGLAVADHLDLGVVVGPRRRSRAARRARDGRRRSPGARWSLAGQAMVRNSVTRSRRACASRAKVRNGHDVGVVGRDRDEAVVVDAGGRRPSPAAGRRAARARPGCSRTSSRMFLLNSWLSRIARSLSSRSRSRVASSRSTPERRKSRSVRSSTRAASASRPLGVEAGEDGIQLGVEAEVGVELLHLLGHGLGPLADGRVGVHLGEERTDRGGVGQRRLRVVPDPQHLERLPGRVAAQALDEGPRQRELLLAAGADPVEPVARRGAGAGAVGSVVTDGTVCRPTGGSGRTRPCAPVPPETAPQFPELQRTGHDPGEVVGSDLARARREQPLLLERPLDEVVDVVLVVADGVQAVGQADVAHQVDEDAGQHVARRRSPSGRRGRGRAAGRRPGGARDRTRTSSGTPRVRSAPRPCRAAPSARPGG